MSLGESFPEVLQATLRGSEWAWTALYRDLAPLVLGYLRSRGADESEDLTGEVFLQIARDLPAFRGQEAEFRSWVLAITHHRLIDQRRYQWRHPADPAPDDAMNVKAPPGGWDRATAAAPAKPAATVRRKPTSIALQRRGIGLSAVSRAQAGTSAFFCWNE